LAWLLSTGAHWDLLQVIAWGKMFAGYSKTMGLEEAARLTIEGEMCELCRAVDRAKQEERKETPNPESGKCKVVLICQTPQHLVFEVPPVVEWLAGEYIPLERPGDAPPTPPPRLRA